VSVRSRQEAESRAVLKGVFLGVGVSVAGAVVGLVVGFFAGGLIGTFISWITGDEQWRGGYIGSEAGAYIGVGLGVLVGIVTGVYSAVSTIQELRDKEKARQKGLRHEEFEREQRDRREKEDAIRAQHREAADAAEEEWKRGGTLVPIHDAAYDASRSAAAAQRLRTLASETASFLTRRRWPTDPLRLRLGGWFPWEDRRAVRGVDLEGWKLAVLPIAYEFRGEFREDLEWDYTAILATDGTLWLHERHESYQAGTLEEECSVQTVPMSDDGFARWDQIYRSHRRSGENGDISVGYHHWPEYGYRYEYTGRLTSALESLKAKATTGEHGKT
jgi:hypothetical protein